MGERDCPTCGGPVRVVGKTTQHYEPLGVHPERLLAMLRLLGPDEMTPTATRHLESLVEGYGGG